MKEINMNFTTCNSTVILIDAIQNKRQRMNVSTIQALRFDKLNLNLSKTTVSFSRLQFLFSRKGKNLFQTPFVFDNFVYRKGLGSAENKELTFFKTFR